MPKIMIVDDDITSLSMARAILESEYTTIPVRSGYEAVSYTHLTLPTNREG